MVRLSLQMRRQDLFVNRSSHPKLMITDVLQQQQQQQASSASDQEGGGGGGGGGGLQRSVSENDMSIRVRSSANNSDTTTTFTLFMSMSLEKRIELDQQKRRQQQQQAEEQASHSEAASSSHPEIPPSASICSRRFLGVTLALVAGISVILQTGMNTNLRDSFCPSGLATSATSFVVGTVVIFMMSLLHQHWLARNSQKKNQSTTLASTGNNINSEEDDDEEEEEQEKNHWKCNVILTNIRGIPWFAYGGGLLGSAWVTGAIYLAPRLGFATFQLSATAGQLLSGIFCDAIGFLHLSPSSPTPWRVIWITTVLAGTALSAKWGQQQQQQDDDDNTWEEMVLYIFLTALAGSVFPIQACLNYELSQHVRTPFWAVTIQFLVGTILMWILVLLELVAFGKDKDDGAPHIYYDQQQQDDTTLEMQWWMWFGGIFGATIVASVTIGIQILGAVHFTIVFISTQLVSATIADATGAFSYPIIPLNIDGGRRIVGVVIALIACAAFKLPVPSFASFLGAWPSCCNCLNFDHDNNNTSAAAAVMATQNSNDVENNNVNNKGDSESIREVEC